MKMYFKYKTVAKLSLPVTDFLEAKEYLRDDNMLQYLDDSRLAENLEDIYWDLVNPNTVEIGVVSKKMLSPSERYTLSRFISSQNSDGIGDGFRNQDFAFHDTGKEILLSEFDWQTNPYVLREVK